MKQFLSQIKDQSRKISEKSIEELALAIHQLKKQVKPHQKGYQNTSLDKILPEWFALVQEVSFRKIGLKHYDTQLLAGYYLHQGKIVEMKTGEGKTLSSTLPISLNALNKKGVHVVTVNDYLAERDQKWMGKVYEGLGLTVGLVKSESSLQIKKKNYQADITYVTNSELVFDYLRDNSATTKKDVIQRPFHYCVLDELDSILIDEARTPLILSKESGGINENKLGIAKSFIPSLEKETDFQIDKKRKDIYLTEIGETKVKKKLGKASLYDPADPWILEILNALKAHYLFKFDKDYIILNNKIVIVDEFTGRVMEDRRWSGGIHEAVETKENVPIGKGTETKSAITYQNFFTMYPKLAGMTGTAKTAEKEFKEIYNLKVVVLPTEKPLVRKDVADLVYQNERAKWRAVLNQSILCYQKGQPVLIGTSNVAKSELLAELFRAANISHQILNAKPENVSRESEIIAQAGKRFAVTIATNMAGRGTDIILGGNPQFQVKQILSDIFLEGKSCPEKWQEQKETLQQEYSEKKSFSRKLFDNQIELETQLKVDIQNLPYSLEKTSPFFQSFYQQVYQETFSNWKKENEKVKKLGGLFVLGTERHETRRIDNQLRGRAGRQGDPGISQFFVSLDDELLKIFGGDSLRKWVQFLMDDPDEALEANVLTKSLENAQKKVEQYNYDTRKNVFDYDTVLNTQRNEIFIIRKEFLCENIYDDLMIRFLESTLKELIQKPQDLLLLLEKKINVFDSLLGSGASYYIERKKNIFPSSFQKIESLSNMILEEIWITSELTTLEWSIYQTNLFKSYQLEEFLEFFDASWTQHLEYMNYIRETINWKSYGQQNPLIEYNLQAARAFKELIQQIRCYMLYSFSENLLLIE